MKKILIILFTLLVTLFVGFILYVRSMPKPPKYECLSDDDLYALTPDSLPGSYKISGAYKLYYADPFHPEESEHTFYFLPDSLPASAWRRGRLFLEIKPLSKPDTTIYVKGYWSIKNKSKDLFIGHSYGVYTDLNEVLRVSCSSMFDISCTDGKPQVVIQITRMDIGGVDKEHDHFRKLPSQPLLDYMNYPDMPIEKSYKLLYTKYSEIDSTIIEKFKNK